MSLAESNKLQRSPQGVYQADASKPFAYSDGQQSEQQLADIFSQATDLSSSSVELEQKICDWPTEYHLTAKRANLLRPLDLSGVKRVLELGCGCGAISRYLGEQAGITVDAVEGSEVRASLAAQRCRDLDNVRIHSANFNELEFPANEYDLVLFVGVTEYAGRFSDQESDQDALQQLLSIAQHALKSDGAALIAIENRVGLKYLLGAGEDHYGQAWVGIDDYPASTGIRTYSKSQWLEQIDRSGFSHAEFAYPFPDYKVPSVVVADSAINTQAALDAISKTHSRDYLTPFRIEAEAKTWQGLAAADAMGECANSFLILLGQQPASLAKLASFSVCEYAHEAYNWHTQAPLSLANTQRLQQRLAKTTEQVQKLNAELSLLRNSRGWQFLNLLRKLIGKSPA